MPNDANPTEFFSFSKPKAQKTCAKHAPKILINKILGQTFFFMCFEIYSVFFSFRFYLPFFPPNYLSNSSAWATIPPVIICSKIWSWASSVSCSFEISGRCSAWPQSPTRTHWSSSIEVNDARLLGSRTSNRPMRLKKTKKTLSFKITQQCPTT